MVFQKSTHASNWIFTKEKLLELRTKANQDSKSELVKLLSNEQMSLCIDEREESEVVNLFLNMIRHFYRKFVPPLPIQVYGVSVTYFRRFFLAHSVMDFHPREIIVTAIYIACKVLEFPVSMEAFIKNIPKNSDKYHSYIFHSELFLLERLHFDLWVYTPYEPFKALFVALRAFLDDRNALRQQIHDDLDNRECERKRLLEDIQLGYNLINDWYETDVMMIFSPDNIALAVLQALFPEIMKNSQVIMDDDDLSSTFREFVFECVAGNDPAELDRLIDMVARIREFVSQEKFVGNGIDKLKFFENRIDSCRNPKYNPHSELYQSIKKEYDAKFDSFE